MKEFQLSELVKLLLEFKNTKDSFPYRTPRDKIEDLPASEELYHRFLNGDLKTPSHQLGVFGIDSYLLPDGVAFAVEANVDDRSFKEFKAKLLPELGSTKYVWKTYLFKE